MMTINFEAILSSTILVLLFFVLFLLAVFSISLLYYWYKHRLFLNKSFESAKDLVFFKIRVPENNEVEVKAFEQFYSTLLGTKEIGKFDINTSPHISLEIVGDHDGINFFITCPKNIESLVEKAIHSVYADAEITKGDKSIWNIWDRDGFQEFKELYLGKEDYYPLKTYEETEIDVLSSLTSVMSKMGEGEAIAFQLIIRPASGLWKDLGSSKANYMLNKKDKDGNPKVSDKDREKAEVIKSKTKYEGFEGVIRILSVAPQEDTAKQNIKNLQNSLSTLNNPQGNKISTKKFRSYPLLFNEKNQFIYSFIFRVFPYFHIVLPYMKKQVVKGHSVYSTKELATIYHFPNKNVKTPGINWLRSRESYTPSNIPESGLYLGLSDFRGTEKKIFLKDDDRRRHLYIVGQTGTGKSELMKTLAVQDIKNGKGVAFIDPHGSAIADLLLQIPENRVEDVIYFNPGDEDFPMGFNILDVQGDKARNMVVNGFIDLLYKLYDPGHTGIVGPQLERAVRNSMLTVMEVVPGGTMVDVLRLVIDQKYEKELAAKVQDPVVKKYWTDEMANTQAFHRSEKTGYFVSKFDRFVTEKVMRNIMGQSKSAFDLNDVMRNKKILLVDLSKGLLGEENSKFLGLLLIPRILAAAFARPNIQKDYDDFYLYVDEFQNFATPDFVTILSEARKYKLNLTVANQFLAQMEDPIKNAIFGNVGTICSFRVGQDDARYLSEQLQPSFNETDLLNLQVGRFATRLLVDGFPTPPFSMRADWEANVKSPRDENIKAKIIALSQQKYGKPAKEVEEEVNRKMMESSEDESQKPPMAAGANPFASGAYNFANPFAPRPNNNDTNAPFSSGKTPFSAQNGQQGGSSMPVSPFARSAMPPANNPQSPGVAVNPFMPRPMVSPFPVNLGQMNPYPANPFASMFRPVASPYGPSIPNPLTNNPSVPLSQGGNQTGVDENTQKTHNRSFSSISKGRSVADVAPIPNTGNSSFTNTPPINPMGNIYPRPVVMPYSMPFANPYMPNISGSYPSANPIPANPPSQNSQPLSDDNQQDDEQLHKRGAISLADLKKDVKSFNKSPSSPPPRPAFKGPVSVVGTNNLPKTDDPVNPKNSKVI